MIKIPKRFSILGHTVDVVLTNEPFKEKDGTFGYSSYRTDEIEIRTLLGDTPIKHRLMVATFFHELIHFILYYAGASYSGKEDYMHQDEGFVETIAGLLHQAIDSMEFEEVENGKL
jgi:hypothetical protein